MDFAPNPSASVVLGLVLAWNQGKRRAAGHQALHDMKSEGPVGLELLFNGWTWIMLALRLRRLPWPSASTATATASSDRDASS